MADEEVKREEGGAFKLSRTRTHTKVAGPIDILQTAKHRTEQEKEDKRQSKKWETIIFCVLLFLFQGILVLIYAIWLKYLDDFEAGEDVERFWFYTRDVSIMIFFGFGFLMTFLRRCGYSAIGYTFLISALVVQWAIPLCVFVNLHNPGLGIHEHFAKYHPIGVEHILNGLFCAGAVMISYGAILGKVTPLQMLIMGIVEPMWYWLSVYIGVNLLEVADVGGGIFIHTFGCYFGLTVCWVLRTKDSLGHPDNTACYSADIFSLAGTLFLWLLWPSFNAAIATPAGQDRAVINTVLSLTASTSATFLFTRIWGGGKIDAVHVQNATLAGGVVMGVAADQSFNPATAIGMGFLAGAISTTGYHIISPFLNNKLRIQDICGVNNLHGMPGLLGSIFSVFTTLIIGSRGDFPHGGKQPGFQMAAICTNFALAIIGGLVTGFLMWIAKKVYSLFAEDYFNDRNFWVLPSDYDNVVRVDGEGSETTFAAIAPGAYPSSKV